MTLCRSHHRLVAAPLICSAPPRIVIALSRAFWGGSSSGWAGDQTLLIHVESRRTGPATLLSLHVGRTKGNRMSKTAARKVGSLPCR